MKIPCYSLWQPYASAMSLDLKRIETRGRVSHHRGLIAIHAAERWTKEEKAFWAELKDPESAAAKSGNGRGFSRVREVFPDGPPLGCIVGVCVQTGCQRSEVLLPKVRNTPEMLLGDYSEQRFGWLTDGMIPLREPFGFKGNRGTFYWEPEKLPTFLSQPFDCIATAIHGSEYAVCLHCGFGRFTNPLPVECPTCNALFGLPFYGHATTQKPREVIPAAPAPSNPETSTGGLDAESK